MQFDNNTTKVPASWMPFDESNTANNDTILTEVSALISTGKKTIEKSKRKQVKNACVNCQKACKKCDDGRPCKRCVKLGLTATCRDSDRKERKKGVKRGPYKKRQAYIKDKPVYPKLLTEEHWAAPIYEAVPQVLSHSNNQSIYNDLYEDSYCVPSQSTSSLSPTSSSSFVDESDETLYYAYGYGYTNNTTTATTTTITTTSSSSPSASSMLDHQTISGNVTPIQDSSSYSWDDIETYGNASPIGWNPVLSENSAIQFQFSSSADAIYLEQQQQQKSLNLTQPLSTILNQPTYWFNNDIPLDYPSHQPIISTPIQPPQPTQNYFEYSIPSQYNPCWSYTN